MNTYILGTIRARAIKLDGILSLYRTLTILALKLDHAPFRSCKLLKIELQPQFDLVATENAAKCVADPIKCIYYR